MQFDFDTFDIFLKLNEEQTEVFKQWARDNWKPNTLTSRLWHPVVRDEWARLDYESTNKQKGE